MLRYKYLPVDGSFKEPFDQKGALSVIRDGTIKFSHANEFNDPFDCYQEVDLNKLSKSFSENEKFYKNIGDELRLTPAQRIIEKPKQRKKLENEFFSNLAEIFNNQIGICSLSRNPLNLLMWAHYATSHFGFVVEFSIPSLLDSDCHCLVPFPVKYNNEKPIITHYKCFKEHFLTKSLDWEYEKEERVIDLNRGHGIHPYDRKKILKSVIAGMRMSDTDFSASFIHRFTLFLITDA